MNKKILAVFGVLIVLTMLTLPMSVVFAKDNPKFIDVNGQIIIWGGGDLVFTPAGQSGNQILVVSGNAVEWTGTLAGTGSADGHFLLHKDGLATARNIHTLEAEVEGKSGTLTIISVQAKMYGQWRILSGTGDLANLHGHGTVSIMTPPVLYSYTGQVHFDP